MPDESTIKLGSIAAFEMGQSPPSSVVVEGDAATPFLQGCADFGQQYPQPQFSCLRPPKLCKEGDVLVSVRAPVGAINKADREYCIGRGLAAVRMTGHYPQNYGWHLMGYWAPHLRRVAQGTTFEAVGRDDLSNLDVVDIPSDDRSGVAAVLDAADEAIAKTEVLIAKLRAIKQGLLHDLLTRGLDANGELRDPQTHPDQFKDSPLGCIPAGWRVAYLTAFFPGSEGIRPGPFGSTITKAMYAGQGYKVYGQEQVIAGNLDVGTYYISESKFRELSGFRVQENDILVSLVGTIGEVLTVREPFKPGIINPRLIRLRPELKTCSVAFVRHLLTSHVIRRQLVRLSNGVTMPVLNGRIMRSVIVPNPPPTEQERIAQILDADDGRLRAEDRFLAKMRAIKKALMQDLLSGRVRVNVNA